MWRGSMLSGRPTWPICRVSPGKTGTRYLLTVIDVCSKFAWAVPVNSKDAKAITVAFGQVLPIANPRHPKRLQTDKGKEFFNSNFQTLMKRHGSSTLLVKANKRRPWWSDLIGPSIPGYEQICRTAAPCVGWMSSRTWSTPATTRITAPSAWRRPMSRKRTRTVSGCAFLETETLSLSLKFRTEPWCKPAATRQFLTRDTCKTGPRST